MADQKPAPRSAPPQEPRKSGWWWKFTALFMGVPPIAVYGAEDEVEAEREARRAE